LVGGGGKGLIFMYTDPHTFPDIISGCQLCERITVFSFLLVVPDLLPASVPQASISRFGPEFTPELNKNMTSVNYYKYYYKYP